ncbi:MerR family transcriptional regulator [Levilactobacillus acidifarinae]|uniref:MerR family transcriptional regulator n=1 Tax=Levilactobacillus acidifarinae TaxID=267364 RepID=UPI00070BEE8E|nr:MerR family transcriptional regulator [Levilactobacillus acidifarinae]GEO68198.1 transcriptional regulator [Levilactobacillus acidifarinae]
MNINGVSKEFNVSKDTLRYWERIGLLPEIKRNASGYRDYSERDLNWVYYIQVLRNGGMSIESLIEFVKLYREGNASNDVRKSLLVDQRDAMLEQVAQLQKTVNYLQFKIDHFEDHTLNYEKEKLALDDK